MEVMVLLAPGCSWLAASLLTEPWRVANRLHASTTVHYRFVSWDGEAVLATNGMPIAVSGMADDGTQPDMLVIIAGEMPEASHSPYLTEWLRRLDRLGVIVAGVDTGAEILAEAGLLDNHLSALHHEAIPAFRERHFGLGLSYGLYTIETRRATCAGGVATLDFSLALLAQFVSESLAHEVAAALIYSRRASVMEAVFTTAGEGWIDARLTRAVRTLSTLQANQSHAVATAAASAGVSERQLQRLFNNAFGCTPRQYLQRVHLQKAKTLLLETSLSITAIALAVGYASASEFSRAWKTVYGQSPSAYRKHP